VVQNRYFIACKIQTTAVARTKEKRCKYVKNVILLVGEKKNIHTHFGMQTDDAQLHGNHVHRHVGNKWILTISDVHFCTC
jgi:hypothetical protein